MSAVKNEVATGKVVLRNPVQEVIFENFLKPELIRGHWKGAYPFGHGDAWAAAEVASNENKVGVDFEPPKANYDLLNKDFVDAIAPKAIRKIKAETGNEVDVKALRRELKDMMFIMRTPLGEPLAESHQGMMDRPGRPSREDIESLKSRVRAARKRK